MVSVCLYFQVHQPHRLRKYHVFDINNTQDYFDIEKNKEICRRVAEDCYLPANKVLLKLIKRFKGKFKIAFSISGTAIEQFEEYAPKVLKSFRELADTGCVEFLSETYHHSLSYIYSKKEFKEQLELHKKKIKELFDQEPKIFRNTELIMNNEMSHYIEHMGYKGILAEGSDHILGWRNPNYVYKTVSNKKTGVLLRNYKLSDDIAFRFSQTNWKEYPLTADKYAKWINGAGNNGEIVNLFMDYETFGEHHSKESGILEFLEKFPEAVLNNNDLFFTPCEIIDKHPIKGEVDMHNFLSWADVERDVSAWTGNPMQINSLEELYGMEEAVKKSKDKDLLKDWRWLTTSDHFYYMSTKSLSDGLIHNYFNPYTSPYEAFVAYMNILNDIVLRANAKIEKIKITEKPSKSVLKKGRK